MAGIYIHIPFCKQACNYCNFHFSTNLKQRDEMVAAIIGEIRLRKNFLKEKSLDSIYFGGGTPSLLTISELKAIFDELRKYWFWNESSEITLEANPDDLSNKKIYALKNLGVNRLSIGIQSFFDKDLSFMNRAHNAAEALQCIGIAREEGIQNLSIDLIFGSPSTTDDMWKRNLDLFLSFGLSHLSAYALTIEPKTKLAHDIKVGKLDDVDDEKVSRQFIYLMDTLETNGYTQYEISNYALSGAQAVHNTNYWKNEVYLGIGPGAHSYDGKTRRWNIANNPKYILGINENQTFHSEEKLTSSELYNEYIMTSLRTIWGVKASYVQSNFPEYTETFRKGIESCLKQEFLFLSDDAYVLTREGKLFADRIAMTLFA